MPALLKESRIKVLIFGASGMLGSMLMRRLSDDTRYRVYGTLRDDKKREFYPPNLHEYLYAGVDVDVERSIKHTIEGISPDVVINAVGLIKQLQTASDPIATIRINSLFPHILHTYCRANGCRLIHISTDCVFDGLRGGYKEDDKSNADDLYGQTKFLGEVTSDDALTIRTSIVGPEFGSSNGLLEWFLSQQSSINGFQKAVFSGLPTVEVADVIRNLILPSDVKSGLFHLASQPINKFKLLNLFADVYGKKIDIKSSDEVVVDRSLNAEKFAGVFNYYPRNWEDLCRKMYGFKFD